MSVARAELDLVRIRLAERGQPPSAANVAAALRATGGLPSDADVLATVEALRLDSEGAGVLEPLLHRPGVTDVLVNGPDEVYVEDSGGIARVPVRFPDDGAVRRLAQRLAASAGRRLDDAAPYADVRLPNGTRLHAVLAPLSRPGTCLSLRVPSRTTLRLADLVASGSLTETGAALLRRIMRGRLAFVISGGTGSGKTTLLAALLSEVDPDERLVIVEDSVELRPAAPHVVSLEARQPNIEGAGEVTLRDLVRQALRMRPDRLVVGEVRGAEVVDMLAALNTGHAGGCTTMHANGPADVPARIEALAMAAGLDRAAVHAQVSAALDLVVHVSRARGHRWVSDVAVVRRTPEGVAVVPAVRFDATGGVTAREGETGLAALLAARDPA